MNWHRTQMCAVIAAGILMGALAASAEQETSCAADASVDYARMATLNGREVGSWAEAQTATGVSLAEALRMHDIDISELTKGTEMPFVLSGQVANSIFVLEREVQGEPMSHTWVILYAVAPVPVRKALEQQGINYPWSGFVLTLDGSDSEAALRLSMLGQPGSQLIYNPQTRTFEPALIRSLTGRPQAESQGCVSCILDLVKSVVCEAVADGAACATLAGCPGAVLSALIRATFKLVTGDLCFLGDINSCANSCGLQQIRLTPESNAQLRSGSQKITVNTLSGRNVGAWALAVKQSGFPGVPLIHLGTSNQQVLTWKPSDGVYTLYAGNIPVPAASIPGLGRSTNVTVGQSATAAVSWKIVDGCNDGRGFRIRFFDKTRGGVYPSQGGYFTVPSGGEVTFSMTVPRGSKLCKGAVQDPPTSFYWCYGLDGNQNADYPGAGICCYDVPASGTLDVGSTLICD